MKILIRRKMITIGILVIVMASLIATSVSAWTTFRSYYFSLNGWDGPMYIDMNAYCPYSAKIEIYSSQTGLTTYTHGPLNGNWRQFTNMQPRITYSVSLHCFDGANQGSSRYMSVWFSGASISVW